MSLILAARPPYIVARLPELSWLLNIVDAARIVPLVAVSRNTHTNASTHSQLQQFSAKLEARFLLPGSAARKLHLEPSGPLISSSCSVQGRGQVGCRQKKSGLISLSLLRPDLNPASARRTCCRPFGESICGSLSVPLLVRLACPIIACDVSSSVTA